MVLAQTGLSLLCKPVLFYLLYKMDQANGPIENRTKMAAIFFLLFENRSFENRTISSGFQMAFEIRIIWDQIYFQPFENRTHPVFSLIKLQFVNKNIQLSQLQSFLKMFKRNIKLQIFCEFLKMWNLVSLNVHYEDGAQDGPQGTEEVGFVDLQCDVGLNCRTIVPLLSTLCNKSNIVGIRKLDIT